MLILSRKSLETVTLRPDKRIATAIDQLTRNEVASAIALLRDCLRDPVEVTVVRIGPNTAKLGFTAPTTMVIVRNELDSDMQAA